MSSINHQDRKTPGRDEQTMNASRDGRRTLLDVYQNLRAADVRR
jgi:hypothetical protein